LDTIEAKRPIRCPLASITTTCVRIARVVGALSSVIPVLDAHRNPIPSHAEDPTAARHASVRTRDAASVDADGWVGNVSLDRASSRGLDGDRTLSILLRCRVTERAKWRARGRSLSLRGERHQCKTKTGLNIVDSLKLSVVFFALRFSTSMWSFIDVFRLKYERHDRGVELKRRVGALTRRDGLVYVRNLKVTF